MKIQQPGKTLFSMLLASMLFVVQSVHAQDEYTFAVFPHLPPADIERIFAPMAKELSVAIGKPVKFTSATSFTSFKSRLMNEEFDIAFVQPFDYVTIADELGYIPLAARGEDLKAIIVVRPDSGINSIQDLKGKKIATPPRIAAVSYLIKDHLQQNNLKPGKDTRIVYRRSHISCMQQVQIRSVDACGTARPPLRVYRARMKKNLKIIGETRAIPHALFAVHPRVDASVRDTIAQRILAWKDTPEGKKILSTGYFRSFKPTQDSTYNIVREIKKKNNRRR